MAALSLQDLPSVVPVFAISGALLLPGGRIPLTVFEPRYLAMTDDALGAGRLFALVQPGHAPGGAAKGLYSVGCLARITAFGETGDGRYVITALGVCRFRLRGEEAERSGYRRVLADYREFAADLDGADHSPVDRARLLKAVGTYMTRHGIALDLAKLEGADDGELVTVLAMAAPLSPEEKQALLEAGSNAERSSLLITLFEMSLLGESTGGTIRH